jgi:transcriptional regulator with XRE-family HTH domain
MPSERFGLSNQLREIIQSRGLGFVDLAELSNVDVGIIRRFVSGRRGLTMATADRIARALGVRLVEVGTTRTPAKARPIRKPDPDKPPAT